jgi:hypothetical protein
MGSPLVAVQPGTRLPAVDTPMAVSGLTPECDGVARNMDQFEAVTVFAVAACDCPGTLRDIKHEARSTRPTLGDARRLTDDHIKSPPTKSV